MKTINLLFKSVNPVIVLTLFVSKLLYVTSYALAFSTPVHSTCIPKGEIVSGLIQTFAGGGSAVVNFTVAFDPAFDSEIAATKISYVSPTSSPARTARDDPVTSPVPTTFSPGSAKTR